MKVDWLRPELSRSFASMESTSVTNPGTGQSTSTWRGGQYFGTVPNALARVTGLAGVHADQDTGEEYVKVSGEMVTRPRYADQPPGFYDHDYWSYGYAGWPIIAAVPSDPFNALITDSDPEHEFGGREVPLVGGLDPDSDLPLLVSYPKPGVGGAPITIGVNGGWREGPAAGGQGPGWYEQQGPEPPIPQLMPANSSWKFKAVSQRCWVLILIDPSSHGFYRDPNASVGAGAEWDGDPLVIHPQAPPPLLAPFCWFVLIWRRGPGSGQPGTFPYTQSGSGGSPTTVTVK